MVSRLLLRDSKRIPDDGLGYNLSGFRGYGVLRVRCVATRFRRI